MQKVIQQAKGPIQCDLKIQGSRILASRALMLAALANGVSEIKNIPPTITIKMLIKSMQHLGIVMQYDEVGGSCIIGGGNGEFPKKEATLDCGDSKTALSFLILATAVSSNVIYFDGATNLKKIRQTELFNLLIRQGAQVIPSDATKLPVTLIGAEILKGGKINISSHLNHKIVSALLMVAPFARNTPILNLEHAIYQPHLDMTCAMMGEFDVMVHRAHQGQFSIPVPQRYSANDYTIEPDYTYAAYFLAAAAITGGTITLQNANPSQSKQVDVQVFSYLKEMGCHIQLTANHVSVSAPPKLKGIEVTLPYFSDLFCILAAIAPFADTPTYISHLGGLHRIEVERFIIMKSEFAKLGIRFESGDEWLRIYPSTPRGSSIHSHGFHRISRALSLIGLKVPGIVIEDAESVTKITPDFFDRLSALAESTQIA